MCPSVAAVPQGCRALCNMAYNPANQAALLEAKAYEVAQGKKHLRVKCAQGM